MLKRTSVRFEGAKPLPSFFPVRDVNRDGMPDLLLRFRSKDTEIRCGDTEGVITGETDSGQSFQGSDRIETLCLPRPVCDVEATVGADTVTLTFELGTLGPAQWTLRASDYRTTVSLWSVPVPTIDPPVKFSIELPASHLAPDLFFISALTKGERLLCLDVDRL